MVGQTVCIETFDSQAAQRRPGDDVVLTVARGQLDEKMETGRYPENAHLWGVSS